MNRPESDFGQTRPIVSRSRKSVLFSKKIGIDLTDNSGILRPMPKRSIPLILIFRALADSTRLAVVERLSQGPASTKELATPFKMALPSFLQHLEVLQSCDLVRSSKTGRVRTFELAPGALKAAEDWMAKQRIVWERRLDQLDHFLNDLKEQSE